MIVCPKCHYQTPRGRCLARATPTWPYIMRSLIALNCLNPNDRERPKEKTSGYEIELRRIGGLPKSGDAEKNERDDEEY